MTEILHVSICCSMLETNTVPVHLLTSMSARALLIYGTTYASITLSRMRLFALK